MAGIETPPDLGSAIQVFAQQFVTLMSTLLSAVDTTVIAVARMAYVSTLLLGILLYFTHVERRLGPDLVKGGVVLAVLSELIFPAVLRT